MRFAEIDLFGIYLAPIAPMMLAAWVLTVALRRVAARYGALRHVWHPALFVFSVYVIILAAIMAAVAGWSGAPWPWTTR